jgi:hypothetical protein
MKIPQQAAAQGQISRRWLLDAPLSHGMTSIFLAAFA